MTYLDKAALLAALTSLQERDINVPALGGQVRIRELTVGERLQAEQAAIAAGELDQADDALFRAMVVSFGMVEPKLTLEDVAVLRDGRAGAVKQLAVDILNLSEAVPGSLKSGGAKTDQG